MHRRHVPCAELLEQQGSVGTALPRVLRVRVVGEGGNFACECQRYVELSVHQPSRRLIR